MFNQHDNMDRLSCLVPPFTEKTEIVCCNSGDYFRCLLKYCSKRLRNVLEIKYLKC